MNGTKLNVLFFLIGCIVIAAAAPKGTKGKRQAPPMPEMPDFPKPPFPIESWQENVADMAETFTRFKREAPPSKPEGPPQSADESTSRVARQAPPQSPPVKRIARESLNADNSKHLRQQTLYSSVTTLSRK